MRGTWHFQGVRGATWLLVVVAIGAIARADPLTGTVVISCNEDNAELIVDGVLIPERTPAVLTLPVGSHVIEARKPPLIAQKKVIEVADQQQLKLRFELTPPAPPQPPPTPDAGVGGDAGVPPASGSVAPPVPPPPPPVKPPRCTEGGREVPCPPPGPRCSQGGKPVSCTTGAPLPPPLPPPSPLPPPPPLATGAAGSGAGSNGSAEPPPPPPGAATIEIATTSPHAIAYLDGAPLHAAPCVLEVEPGEHVVAVYAAGMVPAEAIVRVGAAQRQHVDLTPSKPRKRIDVPTQ